MLHWQWQEFNEPRDVQDWLNIMNEMYTVKDVIIVCPNRASVMGIFQVFIQYVLS